MVRAVEPAAHSSDAESPRDTYPDEKLPDSAGGELSLNAARGKAATVLVSLSVDCPISNEYVPTLNRLADRYRVRGVNFVGVDPNAGESLTEMAQYAREAKFTFPLVKDVDRKVSRRLNFQVTPEVRLFDAKGSLVYRGRIDDRYRSRAATGGAAPAADLERALDELLAGKPISVSHTRAMGCPIN